jgi:hypothetical protein
MLILSILYLGCLPFYETCGHLLFAIKLRTSSLCKKIRLSFNLFWLNFLSYNCYKACLADFKLFHYCSGQTDGRTIGRLDGLNENTANSVHQLKLDLGLGWAIVCQKVLIGETCVPACQIFKYCSIYQTQLNWLAKVSSQKLWNVK